VRVFVERTRYYLLNAGEEVATRFFEAAIAALKAVERMPGTGSPRIGERCDIPSLWVRRIGGFPCGSFYFDRHDHMSCRQRAPRRQRAVAVHGSPALSIEGTSSGRSRRAQDSRVGDGHDDLP
jgi:toxin ParE1/3/4